MNEGTVRMLSEMWALVAEMEYQKALMKSAEVLNKEEGLSKFYYECAQCFEEIATLLREEI